MATTSDQQYLFSSLYNKQLWVAIASDLSANMTTNGTKSVARLELTIEFEGGELKRTDYVLQQLEESSRRIALACNVTVLNRKFSLENCNASRVDSIKESVANASTSQQSTSAEAVAAVTESSRSDHAIDCICIWCNDPNAHCPPQQSSSEKRKCEETVSKSTTVRGPMYNTWEEDSDVEESRAVDSVSIANMQVNPSVVGRCSEQYWISSLLLNFKATYANRSDVGNTRDLYFRYETDAILGRMMYIIGPKYVRNWNIKHSVRNTYRNVMIVTGEYRSLEPRPIRLCMRRDFDLQGKRRFAATYFEVREVKRADNVKVATRHVLDRYYGTQKANNETLLISKVDTFIKSSVRTDNGWDC